MRRKTSILNHWVFPSLVSLPHHLRRSVGPACRLAWACVGTVWAGKIKERGSWTIHRQDPLSCRPPPHTGTTTHRITLTISTSRPRTLSSHPDPTIHLSTTIPNRFDYMSAVSRGSSTSKKGRVSCRPPHTVTT